MAMRKRAFPSLRSTGSVAYSIMSVEIREKKATGTDYVPPKSSEVPVWVDCSQFFKDGPRLLHRRYLGWINSTAKEQLGPNICQPRPLSCAGDRP